MSGGDLVLVRESAEDLFPADPVFSKVDWLGWLGASLIRCELAEGTVRPVGLDYSIWPGLAWAVFRAEIIAE